MTTAVLFGAAAGAGPATATAEERVRAPAAGVALELTRGGADTDLVLEEGVDAAGFAAGAAAAGFAAGAGVAVFAAGAAFAVGADAAWAADLARCIEPTDCAVASLEASAAARAAAATRQTGREMNWFRFKIHSWFGTAERGSDLELC